MSLKISIFIDIRPSKKDMISKTRLSYSLLCEQCFLSLSPVNKWRKDFIKDVLWLFLSIPSIKGLENKRKLQGVVWAIHRLL